MIGLDNRTGPKSALVSEDIRAIQRARAMRPRPTIPELAAAFGLSERTVKRYQAGQVVDVDVAGHRISFFVLPGKRPTLLDRRRRP